MGHPIELFQRAGTSTQAAMAGAAGDFDPQTGLPTRAARTFAEAAQFAFTQNQFVNRLAQRARSQAEATIQQALGLIQRGGPGSLAVLTSPLFTQLANIRGQVTFQPFDFTAGIQRRTPSLGGFPSITRQGQPRQERLSTFGQFIPARDPSQQFLPSFPSGFNPLLQPGLPQGTFPLVRPDEEFPGPEFGGFDLDQFGGGGGFAPFTGATFPDFSQEQAGFRPFTGATFPDVPPFDPFGGLPGGGFDFGQPEPGPIETGEFDFFGEFGGGVPEGGFTLEESFELERVNIPIGTQFPVRG